MAARRLLIVLLVMLAVSTLAAALVPAPRRESGKGRTGTATGATTGGRTAPEAPAGGLAHASIDTTARRPVTVRLAAGDQLSLLVRSRRPDQVLLPAFGLVEPVSRDAPAQLDVLVDRAGRFDIRLREARRTVGTIVARERGGGA